MPHTLKDICRSLQILYNFNVKAAALLLQVKKAHAFKFQAQNKTLKLTKFTHNLITISL